MGKKVAALMGCVILAVAGVMAAAAATSETTGTVSVCATATTPSHTVGVDGSGVDTIPGDTASQCATTTYTVPTVTTTQTVTTTPSSGSVLFDGRATNMTDLQSHEVCSTCGYNLGPVTWPDGTVHYFYQNETPSIWKPKDANGYKGCLCFIRDDISLASDPYFGQVYKASSTWGLSSNPWGTTISHAGGGQLSRQRANDIGKWDYFAIATKMDSFYGPVSGLIHFGIASLGYETFANDQFGFDLMDNNGVLSYGIHANVGYVDQTSSTQSTHGDHYYGATWMPVTFGQWDEWVFAVKWSCGTDGQLEVYHRVPGGNWSLIFSKLNYPTLLWGTTVNYGSRAYNGTWGVMDKIGTYWNSTGQTGTQTMYESGLTRSSDLATAEATLP